VFGLGQTFGPSLPVGYELLWGNKERADALHLSSGGMSTSDASLLLILLKSCAKPVGIHPTREMFPENRADIFLKTAVMKMAGPWPLA
jgi:hypothetical protein